MEYSTLNCPKATFFVPVSLQNPSRFGPFSRNSRVPLPRCDPKPGTRLVAATAHESAAPAERWQGRNKGDDDGVSLTELVEALESLEEEAIAGKDEGREPMDYDRRARIFYESSRVFQALKERDAAAAAAAAGGDVSESEKSQRTSAVE